MFEFMFIGVCLLAIVVFWSVEKYRRLRSAVRNIVSTESIGPLGELLQYEPVRRALRKSHLEAMFKGLAAEETLESSEIKLALNNIIASRPDLDREINILIRRLIGKMTSMSDSHWVLGFIVKITDGNPTGHLAYNTWLTRTMELKKGEKVGSLSH